MPTIRRRRASGEWLCSRTRPSIRGPREKASAVSRGSKPLGAGRLEAQGVGPLLERVVSILEAARGQVVRSVNNAMVLAYWQIGREIVEYYQAGAVRPSTETSSSTCSRLSFENELDGATRPQTCAISGRFTSRTPSALPRFATSKVANLELSLQRSGRLLRRSA